MDSLVYLLFYHLTYLGIFVGTFIEGPMVALLSGFLVRIGVLNFWIAYAVHMLGDLSADVLYYYIGSHGYSRYAKKIKISPENVKRAEKIKDMMQSHPGKIIIIGKLTHIIGLPVLVGMGMARYSMSRFLFFNLIATSIKSLLLILLGYYLADYWVKADNFFSYLSIVGFTILLFIVIFFTIKRVIKNLWEK